MRVILKLKENYYICETESYRSMVGCHCGENNARIFYPAPVETQARSVDRIFET